MLKMMCQLTALKRTCWWVKEGPLLTQVRNPNSLKPHLQHWLSAAVLVEGLLCGALTTLLFTSSPLFKRKLTMSCPHSRLDGRGKLEEGGDLAKPRAA